MSKTLRLTFNVFVSDGFEKAVREHFNYSEDAELDNYDIKEFLEFSMDPARSNDESFEIEGGDTDGWFVQCVEGDL